MNRRSFLRGAVTGALTGALSLGGTSALKSGSRWRAGIRLEAFLNTGMPPVLVLPPEAPAAAIFELRAYAAPGPAVDLLPELLRAAGTQALPWGQRTYLIPFAGLGERAEVWSRVNMHPRWSGTAYRFGLYRRVKDELSS